MTEGLPHVCKKEINNVRQKFSHKLGSRLTSAIVSFDFDTQFKQTQFKQMFRMTSACGVKLFDCNELVNTLLKLLGKFILQIGPRPQPADYLLSAKSFLGVKTPTSKLTYLITMATR